MSGEHAEPAAVFDQASNLLREEIGIEHVTLQVEPPGFDDQKEVPL